MSYASVCVRYRVVQAQNRGEIAARSLASSQLLATDGGERHHSD